MKKTLKISGIVLGSIIAIVLIVALIAIYIVFTPERLTPIVKDQAKIYLKCNTELERVNLTFFSTFPNFALEIENLTLTDSVNHSDTIAHMDKLSADINLTEFLFNSNLIINGVELTNAEANIHVDSLGNANYDRLNLPPSEEEEDTSAFNLFEAMKIEYVDITKLNASYLDEQAKMQAEVNDLNLHIDGFYQGINADANIKLTMDNILFKMNDSTQMYANLKNSEISAVASMKDMHLTAELATLFPNFNFAMSGDTLAKDLNLDLAIPLEWNNDVKLLNLKDAHLIVSQLVFDMNGSAKIQDDKSVAVDMDIDAKNWDFKDILAIVPKAYSGFLSDFKTLDGTLSMNANAEGIYNDSTMPIMTAAMLIDSVTVHHNALPAYKFNNTTADMDVYLDLNSKEKSSANIRKLYTRTGSNHLTAKGEVNDFMNKVLMDLNLLVDVNLTELYPVLPKDLPIKMKGRTALDVHVNTSMADLKRKKLEKVLASGTIKYTDLDVVYNDSMHVHDKSGSINVSMPSKVANQQFSPLASLEIKGTNILFDMLGMMRADLEKPSLNVTVSNPLDKSKMFGAAVQFNIDDLDFKMDSITARIKNPVGYASLSPSKSNAKKPLFTVAYKSDYINAKVGSSLDFRSDTIHVRAFSRYVETQTNPLLKWNPVLDVNFNNGHLAMTMFPSDIKIPEIKFNFNPKECKIYNSNIVIDDSDFSLSGDVTNIREFIEKKDLLKGELEFVSENTNIDQLMEFFSGIGGDESAEDEAYAENVDVTKDDKREENAPLREEQIDEANPFMVPKGVDLVLNTNIRNAVLNNNEIQNILGRLTVQDGIVVLEQMGFTSEAAEMQLTGMYRSDRRNHLFAGFDFHLLDIDIESLIDLIPEVDSVVPMLSSFEGSGEFHLVAETYLNASYTPKMSTLRAAAAFEGKDLVVLDSEMFSTIAKYLMFNKKVKNVVDSLAVEMTIYRNEIDIYPFLISMGKWKAVLAGRHNLDMSFNYHISLTDCPLPVRLGLDVKGNMDNIEYDLVPCKYKALYNPKKKKDAMQERTLGLKKTISDALKKRAKPKSERPAE